MIEKYYQDLLPLNQHSENLPYKFITFLPKIISLNVKFAYCSKSLYTPISLLIFTELNYLTYINFLDFCNEGTVGKWLGNRNTYSKFDNFLLSVFLPLLLFLLARLYTIGRGIEQSCLHIFHSPLLDFSKFF